MAASLGYYRRGHGGPILCSGMIRMGDIIEAWDVRYTVIEVEENTVGELIVFLDRPLETCLHPGNYFAFVGSVYDYDFTFAYNRDLGEAHDRPSDVE